MEAKENCWEIKQCGREPGGANTGEFGACPSATEKRLNGVNGGKNGGRCCWAIAGTMCRGKIQGAYASKIINCSNCDFYKLVREEEGRNFAMFFEIQKKLKD